MVQIIRGMHVGFADDGTPLIVQLPSDQCLGNMGELIGADHITYAPDGVPVVASALVCCDAVDNCPRVETDCLLGGISRVLVAYSTEVENCFTAIGLMATLNYCMPSCPPSAAENDDAAGDVAWTDPSNVLLSDNTYATATLSLLQTTQYLKVFNPCCDIPPDATIQKVEVLIEANTSALGIQDYEVKLIKGGVISGNNKAALVDLGLADAVRSYLYTPTQWGVTLTPEDVMAEDFGVAVRYTNLNALSRTASVDNVYIRLHLCTDPTDSNTCDTWPLIMPRTGIDTGVEQRYWRGNLLGLRGGTLELEVCCTGPDLSFTLHSHGCGDAGATVFSACDDPVFVNFGNLTVNDCCTCNDSTETGTINLWLAGNCYLVVNAEHVGYTDEGIPIVARERVCDWDSIPQCDCAPECGLELIITDVVGTGTETDCSCMEGTFPFPFDTGAWVNLAVGSCTGGTTVNMTCFVNLDEDGNPDGTVTLQLDVQCGADTTGSDSGIVPCEDLEELDVTFEVYLTGPSGTCTGECVYRWNEMTVAWELQSSTCTEGCDDCPNQPDDVSPPVGHADIRTQPCTGGGGECCLGWIEVRVRRPPP